MATWSKTSARRKPISSGCLAAQWGERGGGAGTRAAATTVAPGAGTPRYPEYPPHLAMLAPALVLLLASLYPFLTGIQHGSRRTRSSTSGSSNSSGWGHFQMLAATPLFWTALTNTLALHCPGRARNRFLTRDGNCPAVRHSYPSAIVDANRVGPPPSHSNQWLWPDVENDDAAAERHPELAAHPGWCCTAEPWLTDPSTAMSPWGLIDTWSFTPLATIILLAGLQSVPEDPPGCADGRRQRVAGLS